MTQSHSPMSNGQTHWQPAHAVQLPTALADWLTDTGSLTLKLQQTSQQQFYVDLLETGWQKPLAEEALKLAQGVEEVAYCREVILRDGTLPRVYARTIVSRDSYQKLQAQLPIDSLGNRSLGEMLFNDSVMMRGPLEVARLHSGQALFELVRQRGMLPDANVTLWARRSCFYAADNRLLITELFLPSWDE